MHEKGLDASTFCKLELPSSVGRGLRHPGLSLSLWATMVRQQTKHGLWDDRVGGEKSGMEGRIFIIDKLDVHLAISPAVPATQYRLPDIFPFLCSCSAPHATAYHATNYIVQLHLRSPIPALFTRNLASSSPHLIFLTSCLYPLSYLLWSSASLIIRNFPALAITPTTTKAKPSGGHT